MPRYEVSAWVTIKADSLEEAERTRKFLEGYEIAGFVPWLPMELVHIADLGIEEGEMVEIEEYEEVGE